MFHVPLWCKGGTIDPALFMTRYCCRFTKGQRVFRFRTPFDRYILIHDANHFIDVAIAHPHGANLISVFVHILGVDTFIRFIVIVYLAEA